jgi:ankyrin repeat protein
MKRYFSIFCFLVMLMSLLLCAKKQDAESKQNINIIKEAEKKNNDQIIQFINDGKPIDFNYKRESDWKTALHIAVLTNNFSLVEILLRQNVRIDEKDKSDKTAFEEALNLNDQQIKNIFFDRISFQNIFFTFSDNIGKELIRLYSSDKINNKSIQKILNIWLMREFGTSLVLKEQINYNNVDNLLKLGANINGIGKHFDRFTGLHPLFLAVSNNNIQVVKYLISKGADCNIHFDDEPGDTYVGETPLMNAIKGKYNDIAKVLIESGADINLGAKNGKTPLTTAIFYGNDEMKNLLVKLGAKDQVKK